MQATQVMLATQATQATQPKKRGRPPGSKDRQPRKKRANIAGQALPKEEGK